MSPNYQQEVKGIYTGSVSTDNISKIRFINGKNYFNKNVQVYNGVDFTTLPVSTSSSLTTLDQIFNGMQYEPRTGDDIKFYSPRFLDWFEM